MVAAARCRAALAPPGVIFQCICLLRSLEERVEDGVAQVGPEQEDEGQVDGHGAEGEPEHLGGAQQLAGSGGQRWVEWWGW